MASDDRYVLVLTEPQPGYDGDGNPITLEPGTVVNSIVWDGESHYDPGPAYRIVKSDTLQVGDIAD